MIADGPGGEEGGGRWLDRLTEAAWLLAAIASFLDGDRPGGHPDDAAADVLLAHGLLHRRGDGSVERSAELLAIVDGREEPALNAIRSTLSQAAGVAAGTASQRWQSHGAETLRAQGRASAMAGRFLAERVVPTLGLAERFTQGGVLLDVGVGVAELACAFCASLPSARVIGLDPFPLALELAHGTVAANGMADRIELRAHGVEALSSRSAVDLAWLPAPFIPRPAIETGIRRVFDALRPGGWLVLPGTTIEAGVRGATARFQVAAAGGTALRADERHELLVGAGFVEPTQLAVPPGAPEMWAARRDA